MNAMHQFSFNIDIVGACNLTCPTCPNGNMREIKNPKGFMKPELLDKILEKASRECEVTRINLFNWYEPLLHPQIAELIRIVKRRNLRCGLSSNLNILKDPDAVLSAEPDWFRISISGFNQSTYGRTHQGGDVEKVKDNMRRLAESREKTGAKTVIEVHFHRYLGNLDDEVALRDYSEKLGFVWHPGWAYFMPLEKVMSYSGVKAFANTLITQNDREVISMLAMPLDKVLQSAAKLPKKPCILKDDQITIDFQGRVQLCCSMFDFTKATIYDSFLDVSLAEQQKTKDRHPTCKKCMALNIHRYSTFDVPELENLTKDRVVKFYEKKVGLNLVDRSPTLAVDGVVIKAIKTCKKILKSGLKRYLYS